MLVPAFGVFWSLRKPFINGDLELGNNVYTMPSSNRTALIHALEPPSGVRSWWLKYPILYMLFILDWLRLLARRLVRRRRQRRRRPATACRLARRGPPCVRDLRVCCQIRLSGSGPPRGATAGRICRLGRGVRRALAGARPMARGHRRLPLH